MKKEKNIYYSLNEILKTDCTYNVIVGKKSNGKTYACIYHALELYLTKKIESAYLRRFIEDIKSATQICTNLIFNNAIQTICKKYKISCEYTDILYKNKRWYLYYTNEKGEKIIDEHSFLWGFAITSEHATQGNGYPYIHNIIFDEFISRYGYVQDEFLLFQTQLSNLIRDKKDVKIFMLGNTINKYCPYFSDMGIKHIKEQKQGTIDIYTYGDSRLKVAVEYCNDNTKNIKDNANFYYAFDNPKLKMITQGTWEISIYPKLPCHYKPKDIKYIFFIQFDTTLLQCEIIQTIYNDKKVSFIFIHEKTTDLQVRKNQIVYNTEFSPLSNYKRNILKGDSTMEKIIQSYFKNDKVYYSTNDIGDVVFNYLKWCKQN